MMIKMWMKEPLLQLRGLLKIRVVIQILNPRNRIIIIKETRQCNNMKSKDSFLKSRIMDMEKQSRGKNGIIFKVK